MNPTPFESFSLHEKIAGVLRDEIRVLAPGRKLDSESALAKRFSVSRMTPRMTLEMLAQEGWVRRHHGSVSRRCLQRHLLRDGGRVLSA